MDDDEEEIDFEALRWVGGGDLSLDDVRLAVENTLLALEDYNGGLLVEGDEVQAVAYQELDAHGFEELDIRGLVHEDSLLTVAARDFMLAHPHDGFKAFAECRYDGDRGWYVVVRSVKLDADGLDDPLDADMVGEFARAFIRRGEGDLPVSQFCHIMWSESYGLRLDACQY